MSVDAHLPVLLHPAVDALAIESKRGGTFVDATFGRGGHSRLMLERLGPRGRLIGMDRDPEAIAAARDLRDPRFAPVHARFSELQATLVALHAGGADGVLFDLGVSSPQLDDPGRGFSFSASSPRPGSSPWPRCWPLSAPSAPGSSTAATDSSARGVTATGALFGASPSEAFYVKCDSETNPTEVIEAGQVVTEVGICPVKPAEFVVFRLSQFSGGADVAE